MTADRLLANFDRIADAPDAVPRLRRFILELAVRGKLVEQDPNDEPASELLKRIAVEKARLVKAGEIKKTGELPTFKSNGFPFDLQPEWRWARFGIIADFAAGRTPARNETSYWKPGIHAWASIADMRDGGTLAVTKESISKKAAKQVFKSRPCEIGTIIMSFKLTIGKIARLGIPAFHNEAIVSIRPHFSELDSWLFLVLPLFARQVTAKDAVKGATLNRTSITKIPIPIPSLAEQHRIVAKVDELMALCDRLEAARAERETTRDRLATASLACLNAPDPDPATFRDHVSFALDNLTQLTTRRDQIKALRQTILNLAVRGKLVEQDPNDEPVSELLTRIAADKARLIEAGKIRKEKRLPPISGTQTPFPIPRGWSWCRLGNLSRLVTSGSRGWAKYYSREGAVFLRMGNLSKGHYRLRLDQIQRVKPPRHGEGTRTRVEAGDLLISITGDVGMLGMVTNDLGEAYINQHIAVVRPVDEMEDRYLAELLRSPFAQRQFNEPQRGIKNSFRLTDVTQILVPLPPLAEQYRIVAKVDELMALCDQLETNLASCEDTCRRLLDAFLYEAFEPTTDCMATA